jgi:hypothetical protein
MFRRKELRGDLREALDGLRAVVVEVEAAKDAMTSTVPSTRQPGMPLAEAIAEFEDHLGHAKEKMPAWDHPQLEDEWLACDAGIELSLRRTRSLREKPPELAGFEGLIWVVDHVLMPLEVFESAAERFRRLRRLAQTTSGDPIDDLEVSWINGSKPVLVESSEYEDVRVSDRSLFLRDWLGRDTLLWRSAELFGEGPERALVVRLSIRPNVALLVGEEGSELLRLDLDRPVVSRVAELPRVDLEPESGYHRLRLSVRGGLILLNWELGILALDPTLELCWRQDLDWNHQVVYIDDEEIWFDYFYDPEDGAQRMGVEPYGFAVATGAQLFDRKPPGTTAVP